MRIKQDPSQFDLFIAMLGEIEGMDLMVKTLGEGKLSSNLHTYWSLHEHCTKEGIPAQGRYLLLDVMIVGLKWNQGQSRYMDDLLPLPACCTLFP